MLLTKGYALQMEPLYVDDVSNNLETDACCLLWVRNEMDHFVLGSLAFIENWKSHLRYTYCI